MTISSFVHEIFLKLNKYEKELIGGISSTKELEREINNYKQYLKEDKIFRKRIRFGEVAYDQNIPVGYICFTNLNNTLPTKYEKNLIGLNKNLNYVHLRQLIVDSEFQNKKIGTSLVNVCLEFAKKNKKNIVSDVKNENEKIINLLSKNGFYQSFNWKTSNGSEMIRFLHK